jgi:hypothetical protein
MGRFDGDDGFRRSGDLRFIGLVELCRTWAALLGLGNHQGLCR